MFRLSLGLKEALQDTVDTFNKAHNPSGIPWKEHKRPNDENAASAVSESRGIFLPSCYKTVQELESEDAYVFIHVDNPGVHINFKVNMAKDGNKLYLICETYYGLLY